jgi:hypothetical protein
VVILVYFVVILVYFVVILVYFSRFGNLFQEKSGNSGRNSTYQNVESDLFAKDTAKECCHQAIFFLQVCRPKIS